MSLKVRVICIDDRHRPNEVPVNRWVKKGEMYHVIEISRMNMQGGAYGCKLAEINNDDLFPFQYFRLERFAVPEDDGSSIEEWKEVDISELEELLKPEKEPVSK